MLTLLLMIASSAIVGFVVLRHGERSAFQTVAYSTLILIVISLLLFQAVVQLPLYELLFWAPGAAAASALRRSASLNFALLIVLACGILTIIGLQFFANDVTGFWRTYLSEGLKTGLEQQGSLLTAEQLANLLDNMASMMTGALPFR